MKKYDEPMCQNSDEEGYCTDKIIDVKEEIRKLLQAEPFAVLSTQGQGQPYASLMSFAVTDDLEHFIFATPQETRKYSLLTSSDRVAILVDNRSHMPNSLNRISALTVTGKARLLKPEDGTEWSEILIKKHPYQENFIKTPSTALVVVDVYRYFYVRRFQEVTEWSPYQG